MNLELKVENTKQDIDIKYQSMLDESEKRIEEVKKAYEFQIEQLKLHIPQQFAFGKKLSHRICGCEHDDQINNDKILEFSDVLYSIGGPKTTNGSIQIQYRIVFVYDLQAIS